MRSIRLPPSSSADILPVFDMVLGVLTIELFIWESQSLKDKRQVLHSLKDRLRGKFNVSVAEVDGQDLWQKAVLNPMIIAREAAARSTSDSVMPPTPL